MGTVSNTSPSQDSEVNQSLKDGGKGFAPISDAAKGSESEKSSWWPNCSHPRYTKLAQRKFRDRIVILWKCRRCPKQVREVIDIDMNSREVFVKSTKSALPRRYDEEPKD